MNYIQQLQEENSKLQKEIDVLECVIKEYKNGKKYHYTYVDEVNVSDRISTLEKEIEDLKKIIKPKRLFESIKIFLNEIII